MTVNIFKSKAEGLVCAPPSKSAAHRALICGALSQESKIYNVAHSKDITATLQCLQALGAKADKRDGYIVIGSLSPENVSENTLLDCIESGSTLRFLLPLCMLAGKRVKLTGSARLLSRPLTVYEDICRQDSIEFSNDGNCVTVHGTLKGGEYEVPGDISSQFITGLLFALPLCECDSKIIVTGKFESASYIDMTIDIMTRFGIKIERQGNTFYIGGRQKYISAEHTVEGDCSNAAFLDGLNLLGGNVTVTGLSENTLQGDRVYKDMFNRLENEENPLFDLSDCPDLAPVMFALAAAKGGARFIGTRRLKIKESDRGEAMRQELSKFGITLNIEENAITVLPGKLKTPTTALYGHNDHRIVMALSLLCTITGGTIEGADAVTKSYPDFFEILKSLKVGLDII